MPADIRAANANDVPAVAAFDFDELGDVYETVRAPGPSSESLIGDDGEPVCARSTTRAQALSLPELHQQLAAMEVEAKARAAKEASYRAFEDRDHPEPPTLDPVLKSRARLVWVRMRQHGLWHAPWHHEEIWIWAGTTEDGQAWLEREVAHWEVWVEDADRQVRLTMIRLCEEGCGLSDGTTLRTLDKKLQRARNGPLPRRSR